MRPFYWKNRIFGLECDTKSTEAQDLQYVNRDHSPDYWHPPGSIQQVSENAFPVITVTKFLRGL